jgi:tripartite-type tricarboxylate transporter receptor subunit TctC
MSTGIAFAGDWPNSSIKLVVPQPAGTGTDLVARAIGQKLSAKFGQPVVIENKPGGSTLLGTRVVASSDPDGYTLLVTNATLAALAATKPELNLDAEKGLVAVAPLVDNAMVLATGSGAYRSFADFSEQVRAKQASFAVTGYGSFSHILTEATLKSIGASGVMIPYNDASQLITDVVSRRVDFTIAPYAPYVDLLATGKLDALVVFRNTRLSGLPSPTVVEIGKAELQASFWSGLFAPRGVPVQVIEKLDVAVREAVNSGDFIETARRAGGDAMGALSRREFEDLVKADIARFQRVVREARIDVR